MLGADAFLGRRTEAASRMARLRQIRERHPSDEQIKSDWIEAPLRYVIALATGFAPDINGLRVEILRARDEAKKYLAKSEYQKWRERMGGSIKPAFLDQIGF